jgi:predicted phage-related endonuclease
MAKSWNYNEDKNGIIIEPPSQRLRITGHRLSSVLGLNKWQSPFGAWCEITKLVKLPFEDTKYTIFGKVVEPKLIKYVSERFLNVVSIEDYYGVLFKEYEFNNFKDISNVFGGVIDAVSTKADKKTITMICECKTSSNPQDWRDGNVPVDYLLQGALYSYLMGLDRVLFVCTFPEDIDYAHPEEYEVTDKNTILVVKRLEDMLFDINGKYLNIQDCMIKAEEWWNKYIETGISPTFDEKKDKEYLDIIRATDAVKDSSLSEVCLQAFKLAQEIKALKISSGIADKEKELKLLEASIKQEMMDKDVVQCENYKLTPKVTYSFNETSFQEEHEDLYKEYLEEKTSYTLTKQ